MKDVFFKGGVNDQCNQEITTTMRNFVVEEDDAPFEYRVIASRPLNYIRMSVVPTSTRFRPRFQKDQIFLRQSPRKCQSLQRKEDCMCLPQ